MNVDNVTFGHL